VRGPLAGTGDGAKFQRHQQYDRYASTFNTLVPPAIAPDYFRDHNIGVLEQPHPDYEAPGAAIGSFVFHPQATVGTLADNNVYATEAGKKSDVAAVLQMGASLNSSWSRHGLGFRSTPINVAMRPRAAAIRTRGTFSRTAGWTWGAMSCCQWMDASDAITSPPTATI
jgi:hypothetical protein